MTLSEEADEPLCDIEVGGEVAVLGEDRETPRAEGERGREDLEHVDGRRVGAGDLSRRGAHEPRDLVAHAARQVDPPGVVPAPDQPLAPLAPDDVRHARGRRLRQGAERVAVEVDEPVGKDEPVAEGRERVGGVETLGVLARDHGAILSDAIEGAKPEVRPRPALGRILRRPRRGPGSRGRRGRSPPRGRRAPSAPSGTRGSGPRRERGPGPRASARRRT